MPACRCGANLNCDTCKARIHQRGLIWPADGPRTVWAHTPGTRPADGHRAVPGIPDWVALGDDHDEAPR